MQRRNVLHGHQTDTVVPRGHPEIVLLELGVTENHSIFGGRIHHLVYHLHLNPEGKPVASTKVRFSPLTMWSADKLAQQLGAHVDSIWTDYPTFT
jgi:hypothetical protein